MSVVKNGHPDIPEFEYRNPQRPGRGIELFPFADFASRLAAERFGAPHRIDFHQLILVTHGNGAATVDFANHSCGPGTLLHVRPGQVQRLPTTSSGQPAPLDATVLLFARAFPPRLPLIAEPAGDPFGPTAWLLPPDELNILDRAMTDLLVEYRRVEPGVGADTPSTDLLSTDLLRHMLATLLLRIARLPRPSGPEPDTASAETFRRFTHELERSFTTTRQANDYAARLGYSLKTLSRACLIATGHTAKQVIDARVALEAKRLLVHTDLPVHTISHRLGFSEPSNFGKFFTHQSGRTPGEFRATEH